MFGSCVGQPCKGLRKVTQ